MSSGPIVAVITVTYALHPTFKLWLPDVMNERYLVLANPAVEVTGQAEYSNFRQFKVDSSITVK